MVRENATFCCENNYNDSFHYLHKYERNFRSSSSCSMLTLTDIILIVRFYFFFYPQVVGNMDVHKKMVVDV